MVDFIVESFGADNEPIDDETLDELKEELETLDDEEAFEVVCKSIEHGKHQIVECILHDKDFDNKQIGKLKELLEDYVNDCDFDIDFEKLDKPEFEKFLFSEEERNILSNAKKMEELICNKSINNLVSKLMTH